jgi:uncharacterized protein (DUF1697 family)
MTQFIAFLRAINVGGHTVKMGTLRQLFEGFGFSNVETFIASGNVIFEADSGETADHLEQTIENGLHQALGYEVATFLRTVAEVTAVAQYQPFPTAELEAGASLYVAFLKDELDEQAKLRLATLKNEIDDFHTHQREVYWLRRLQLGESKFTGALLEKTLKMPATLRNSTTVRKIAAKYPLTGT